MAIAIILLIQYLLYLSSKPISSSIFKKVELSLTKTPKEPIEIFTNLTLLKYFRCCFTSSLYLMFFLLMFDSRFDSYPTVSSTKYNNELFEDVSSKSGRYLSPVIIDGFLNPGTSAKR